MSEVKGARLSKLAKELNVGISTIVEFLHKKGHDVDKDPNTKIAPELVAILEKEYSKDITVKKQSEQIDLKIMREKKESLTLSDVKKDEEESEFDLGEEPDEPEVIIKSGSTEKPVAEAPKKEKAPIELKVVGKVELTPKPAPKPAPKQPEPKQPEPEKKPAPVEEVKVSPPKVTTIPEPIEETVSQPAPTPHEPEPVETPAPVSEEQKPQVVSTPEKPAAPEVNNGPKVTGFIDLDALNQRTRPPKKSPKERKAERRQREQQPARPVLNQSGSTPDTSAIQENETRENKGEVYRASAPKISGPTVVGKIDLPGTEERRKTVIPASEVDRESRNKKKRKRIKIENRINVPAEGKPQQPPAQGTSAPKELKKDKSVKKEATKSRDRRPIRQEVNEEEVQKQIKDTLARLTAQKGKSKASKYRREKRDIISQRSQDEIERQLQDRNILKVTEFVSVNELATLMDVPPTKVISSCMSLGLFVSINQRLDAETMAIVADEFGYKLEFVSVEIQESIKEEVDSEDDLKPRPPIVTVMGHVDHGKTKLLDYIRSANVVAGEAGGITQHIGAYSVDMADGRRMTFLDTPGHEAFTAMRARGASITDVAIIVIAADDGVMPQTREAINHAQAAGVPIIFAINKIDKPSANPEKIKEELANMNLLVEDWGGKYQSQEISAKSGLNIDLLLEKVMLESEMLDLKANANKRAKGAVVESSLDKGRGYVATILVESGTLRVGDCLLAGSHFGHVKAMFNERGKRIEEAGPSMPVLVLGLNGAPQAGDKFNVMENEKEAKDIATKREQLQREQGLRTRKHITLDEIGRRIAIGNFQELNIIVKGDVDGSVEALSDSLIKLSTPEIQVNIIHKAVGQISESDVLLAAASNAIIIGFQVRPSISARKLAEKEQIDVRLYSIIYSAIEEIKDAMEGMLSPEVREEITATLEVLEAFKITKVGTIAGCMVREGKINRNSKVRIIRDGIVVFTGTLGSLKRFKDDVKEVVAGLDCGLNINNYNDIQVGDTIEAFNEISVKRNL